MTLVRHHDGSFQNDRGLFWQRVLSTYRLTLIISAALLFALDRFDLLHPVVSIKRIILVAFPASFAATAVDSFRS